MNSDLNTELFRKVLDEEAYAETKHQNFPGAQYLAPVNQSPELGEL